MMGQIGIVLLILGFVLMGSVGLVGAVSVLIYLSQHGTLGDVLLTSFLMSAAVVLVGIFMMMFD